MNAGAAQQLLEAEAFLGVNASALGRRWTARPVLEAEVLAGKMDRIAVRMDEGFGDRMQVMVDRMTDAIRSLASGRIDLD